MSPVLATDHAIVLPQSPAGQQLQDSPLPAIKLGTAAAILFFVIFLGWAAIARLDAAATGEGQVAVAGNRQTVQHREGGVVSALLVREGQRVEAGQVLLEIAAADVRAHERSLTDSVINLQAQKARLEAEVSGAPLRWPESFAALTGEDRAMAERAMKLQQSEVRVRQGSLAATQAVIRKQGDQFAHEAQGYGAQRAATERQRRSLQEQLEGSRELAAKGFISKNQIRQIERSIAQLEGVGAEYRARDAAAREQIGRMQRETIQSERKFAEDSANLLRETQFQLNQLLPELRAAREALDRATVRAPASGRVVGLQVFTRGGVIAPGQPLLDIVPDSAQLVVRANFSPADVDGVREGSEAEVRFPSIHDKDLPILLGTVRTLSADALRDPATGQNFFVAEIVVPRAQMDLLRRAREGEAGLRPGLPAQVSIGVRKRTALQYMLEPFTQTFSRSFIER